MRKVWVMLRKEWAEVFKNRFVLFTVAFLPLMLTALPLVILKLSGAEGAGIRAADLPPGFEATCQGLSAANCMQYFLLSQFMLLFMLLPLAIPVTIASYSVVGEKTRRTLEPLLATPIRTVELLLGKALAAALPAVAATWLSFGLYLLGVILLTGSGELLNRLVQPLWLMAVLVVGPLLAVASVSVAVMVSSRSNDPRVAEQISMMVIIPLLGLFFGQMAGLIYLNEQLVLWMALALAIIDAGLVAFAIQLFERETILTRWK